MRYIRRSLSLLLSTLIVSSYCVADASPPSGGTRSITPTSSSRSNQVQNRGAQQGASGERSPAAGVSGRTTFRSFSEFYAAYARTGGFAHNGTGLARNANGADNQVPITALQHQYIIGSSDELASVQLPAASNDGTTSKLSSRVTTSNSNSAGGSGSADDRDRQQGDTSSNDPKGGTQSDNHPSLEDKSKRIGIGKANDKSSTQTRKDAKDSPAGPLNYTEAPTNFGQAENQLGNVINSDFTQWATWACANSNPPVAMSNPPTLTLSQVGSLLANPKITGAQASALAAIAVHLSNDSVADPKITFATAQSLAPLPVQSDGLATRNSPSSTAASSTASSQTSKPQANSSVVKNFKTGMETLTQDSKGKHDFSLYGPGGEPKMSDVRQGPFDNCFFLAAVDGVLRYFGPQAISSMIKADGHDTYSVTFPGQTTVKVKLTAGEVANFSHTKDDGVWLAVLGLAANKFLGSDGWGNGDNQSSDTNTGNVVNTGYPQATMQLLTGKNYADYLQTSVQTEKDASSLSGNGRYFDMTRGDFTIPAKQLFSSFTGITAPVSVMQSVCGACTAITEKQYKEIIQESIRQHSPVSIRANDGGGGHILLITGYDAKTDTVSIFNSWGTSEKYDPVTGNSNRYTSDYYSAQARKDQTQAKNDQTIATNDYTEAKTQTGATATADRAEADRAVSQADRARTKEERAKATVAMMKSKQDRSEARSEEATGDTTAAKNDRTDAQDEKRDANNDYQLAIRSDKSESQAAHALHKQDELLSKEDKTDGSANSPANVSTVRKEGRAATVEADTALAQADALQASSENAQATRDQKQSLKLANKAEAQYTSGKLSTSQKDEKRAARDENAYQSALVNADEDQAKEDKEIHNRDKAQAKLDKQTAREKEQEADLESSKGNATEANIDTMEAAKYRYQAKVDDKDATKGERESRQEEKDADKVALFGPSGTPESFGLRQGRHGDCYFYNVLNWFVDNDPHQLERMITRDEKDTYTVTFANGDKESVKLDVNNQPYSKINGANGTWVDVLANAYAQARGESIDKMLKGGQSHITYEFFTGKTYEPAKLANLTATKMYDVFTENRGQPIGLNTGGHALTVEKFSPDKNDPADSKITVWNPWGSTGYFDPSDDKFSETPPAGSSGWIKMDAGTFTITLGELASKGNMGFKTITRPKATSEAEVKTANRNTANESSSTKTDVTGGGEQANSQFLARTSNALEDSDRSDIGTTVGAGARTANETVPEGDKRAAFKSETNDAIVSDLKHGTVMVMNNKPVVLRSDIGEIEVQPHSVAYVMRLGSEVGVYDLLDTKHGGVKVKVGGETLELTSGKALILTKDQTNQFEELSLSHGVESDMTLDGNHGGVNVFRGKFSYQSALSLSPQFQQFLASKNPKERTVADELLKNLAAIKLAGSAD
jgi:hypothetical protein